jgi:hypothetical protein
MSLSRICAASLLIAASPLLAAANKQHAVIPVPNVTISGVVKDANTGAPIAGAIVHSGAFYSSQTGTGTDGKYTLRLPGARMTSLTVVDFAYETVNVNLIPVEGAVVDLTLTTSRPVVTVKLTNGETHILDLGTSQFAYLQPLSGYIRGDSGNFCKPDGSAFSPSKTEIAKIIGPAVPVDFTTCCKMGQVMRATVELKSGQSSQVYFNDSCFGTEVDFLGRERSTGTYAYFKFTDIAEIDFP